MPYGGGVGEKGLNFLQGAGRFEFEHAPVSRQHKLDFFSLVGSGDHRSAVGGKSIKLPQICRVGWNYFF